MYEEIHEVDFMKINKRSVREWKDKSQGDRKYLKVMYLTKGVYPGSTKN